LKGTIVVSSAGATCWLVGVWTGGYFRIARDTPKMELVRNMSAWLDLFFICTPN
jgi:hypothetical protein